MYCSIIVSVSIHASPSQWPWLQPSYRIVVQPQGPCEWPINCCHLPAAKLQAAADNPTQPGARRRSSFRTPVAGSGPPLTPVGAATVPSQLWDTSAVAWKASRKTWGSTFSTSTSGGEGEQGSSLDQLLQHTSLSLSLGLEPVQRCFVHRCFLAMHRCHHR